MAEAAASASAISDLVFRLFELMSTANRAALGNNSCRNPNRFAVASICKLVTPVTLLSGRLRLATRPIWAGSPAVLKTIGIVVVAAFAASAEVPLGVAMTATCRRTRSAAKSGSLLASPCAERVSIATL